MLQVGCFLGGMQHQRRRKCHQCCCKHGKCHRLIVFSGHGIGIPAMPQVESFLGGHSIGGGNVANATGDVDVNHQCCRWIFWMWHCMRPAMLQADCSFGGMQHQNCKHGTKPPTLQLDCFFLVELKVIVLGGHDIGGCNIANATGKAEPPPTSQVNSFVDIVSKEANNAAGQLFLCDVMSKE